MNLRSISFFLSLFCLPVSLLSFLNILYSSYFDYFLSIEAYFTTLVLSLIFGLSFYFLAAVSQKLPLSIVYASWSGVGIFSIAILSYLFYKQSLNWQTILGLFLIIVGVTVVNIYKN